MKRKGILAIFIIAFVLISSLLYMMGQESEVHGGIEMGKAVTVNLYQESDKEIELKLENYESLGIRFYATTEFSSVDLFINTVNPRRSGVNYQVFSWQGNYKETLTSKAVVFGEESLFVRNEWLNMKFSKDLGSGEYLLVFTDFDGALSLTKYMEQKENTRLYFMGANMAGSLKMRVNYENTPKNKLSKLSEDVPSGDNKVKVNGPTTYVATDGLGRILSGYNEVGSVKEDKFVGIFFWTWHSAFSQSVPRNVTEILKVNPDIVHDVSAKEWGSFSDSSFWNEPIYGYYNGKDPWVFRRQAELLADAGVDVVIFDNSNYTGTFIEGVRVLLETFAKARADGVKTPQISFLMNFWDYNSTVVQLKLLYQEIYQQGKYEDLWFYWKGKPLMVAYPDRLNEEDELEAEILNFFTYRPAQPSYIEGQVRDNQWGWCSVWPQKVYKNEKGEAEQITVSIAQNHNDARGLTAMNGERVFGRHWINAKKDYDDRENAIFYGANFEEQFKYALEVNPEFIFITGWNEWRCGREATWCGVTNAFPDQFNDAYSRDIEPSKGDLKDYYYYQMVSFIRQFKGAEKPSFQSKGATIDINSKEDMWDTVEPYYSAYEGNTFDRNSPGYIGYNYKNFTGRNDIVGSKVTYDKDNIYFMVETADDLTAASDPAWMRLLIDIEGSNDPDWETFNFIVNRDKAGLLEKSKGGWDWEEVGKVEYSTQGNRLQIKIPRSSLGIQNDKFIVNFKWSDNMQEDGDIMDFYTNGDVAPLGRFKYQFSSYELAKKSSNKLAVIGGIIGGLALITGGVFVILSINKNRKKEKEI